MSIVAITHKTGIALAGINVVATLNRTGFRKDHSQALKAQTFTTNNVGEVVMQLERNEDISPPGTHYIVWVKIPAKYGGPQMYTVRAASPQSLQDSRVTV